MMLRVLFFAMLLIAFIINALAFFLRIPGEFGWRDWIIVFSLMLEMILVVWIIIKAKLFQTTGKWVYVKKETENAEDRKV